MTDAVIDIPVPPSVNRTRRVDRASQSIVDAWHKQCDLVLMASGQYRMAKNAKPQGPFELEIILCERQCGLDLDNPLKNGIDLLRRIELIRDDSPAYFRKLTVSWGDAPKGCRMILKPVADHYDAADDVTKSFEAAYEAVKQRVAEGGKSWAPK